MAEFKDIPQIPDSVPPDLRRPLVRMREVLQRIIGSRGPDGQLLGGGGGGGTNTTTIIQLPGEPGGTPEEPDLTPPPTVSNLEAVAGFSQVTVTWSGVGYSEGRGHKQTNIYAVKRAITDPSLPTFPGAAGKVASAPDALTIISLPSEMNTRWHIWAKFETVDGIESVDPAGGTNGVVATTAQDITQLLSLLTGQITRSMLFTTLGSTVDLIEAPSSVPGSVNFRIAATAADLTSAFTSGDATTFANAQTYVQNYTFSQSAITGALTAQFSQLTANYQAADATVLGQAQTSSQAFVTGYAYALAAGNALAGTVNTIGARLARVVNYRVQAKGLSAPLGESSFRAEDGTLISGSARSYNLVVLNGSTGAVVSTQFYDVFGNGEIAAGRNAATLAADLNALGPDRVVVVYTFDEPSTNRLTGGLPDALYRCGASPAVFGGDAFRFRSAYILVGIPGIGPGQGVEKYVGAVDDAPNAWIDYQLQLVNGRPVALGGNPLAVAVQQETTARINADNSLFAQWTVKLDVNGYVSGFGLASTAGNAAPFSQFLVRADSFAVASPSGPGIAPAVPFIVRTTPSTEGGVSVPPGVYIDAAFIVNLTVLYARIQTLVADNIVTASLSAAQLTAGDGTIGGRLKSTNWVSGVSGWQIQPNGAAEFNNVTVRGSIFAGGVFGGALTAATGTFRGALDAASGTFAGSLAAATGTFSGALVAATGTFNGTVRVGDAANSGTTMTGTGAVLAASGAFALGIPGKNIAFNGTDDPRLNGPWVTDGNLSLSAFSVSVDITSVTLFPTDGNPATTIGPTATATGGTAPYVYEWSMNDAYTNPVNAGMAWISGTANSGRYAAPTVVLVQDNSNLNVVMFCSVRDANGRVAGVSVPLYAQRGAPI